MYQVQLTDQVYDQAKRRAAEAGFDSVDEYVADLLSDDFSESPNLDHLFTPERLAHIDDVVARVNAGEKTLTMDEFDANLAEFRANWIRRNGQ
ncbi:MAG TPA: hypothetical protein VGK19_11660 [Capsulimonadaceae bacterium]|jgi:hypothetical protein